MFQRAIGTGIDFIMLALCVRHIQKIEPDGEVKLSLLANGLIEMSYAIARGLRTAEVQMECDLPVACSTSPTTASAAPADFRQLVPRF